MRIGDKFFEEIRVFCDNNINTPKEKIFLSYCHERNIKIEIQYTVQGNRSLTIDFVSCFSAQELSNQTQKNEDVTPKGIFTKIIKYFLKRLNNPNFRVLLMDVVYPTWFKKLRERGWKTISKYNQLLDFYDCDDTSLYLTHS